MLKKRTLAIGVVVLGAAVAAGWWWSGDRSAAPQWRTAKLARGPLTAAVSASGTINPVASVQVGSQVSGQLRDVLVDFNSEVKAGQVVARIDPETFQHRVRQAQADLDAAHAQVAVQEAQVAARRAEVTRAEVTLADGQLDLSRKEQLLARNFISAAERDKSRAVMRAQEEDLRSARAALDVAGAQVRNSEATVKQRIAALAAAQVDLDRTVIRSPVDGVVIKRSVEPGQTVAASLQSPELFVIAKNLHDMQVDTSIDESDIGRIRLEQKATFTVDAFPGRSFEGQVRQVRKAAQNIQNVVTYVVVIQFANADGALLPGMTANVRVATESRTDVLQAPNPALRFRMPPELATRYAPPAAEPARGSDGKGANATGGAASLGSLLLAQLVETAVADAHAQPSGGGGASGFRERIERELQLDPDQLAKLDAIYADLRPRFSALRALPEEERIPAGRAVREELRSRIAAMLRADQKGRFDAIVAEQQAQRAAGPAPGGAAANAGAAPAARPPAAGSAAARAGAAAAGASAAPATAASAGAASAGAASASAASASSTAASASTTAPAASGSSAAAGAGPRPAPGSGNAAPASDASAAAGASGSAPAASGGAGTGAGGPLGAFRERLERELSPTPEQRLKLDAIFASMRDAFGQARTLPEDQRGKAIANARAEMRARIADVLTPEQKKKYEAILVEQAGRGSGRGRLWVLENGKPRAVDVRTGITDGSSTEVAGPGLAEGTEVIIGIVGGSTAPAARPAGGPPRMF